MPQDIMGYLYIQNNPPRGWDPRLYWAWDRPVNVLLVPKIPSANKVWPDEIWSLDFLFPITKTIQGYHHLQGCWPANQPARSQSLARLPWRMGSDPSSLLWTFRGTRMSSGSLHHWTLCLCSGATLNGVRQCQSWLSAAADHALPCHSQSYSRPWPHFSTNSLVRT